MVLLPCAPCCQSPAFGCVLTGFSNALTAFNLASGLSKSYQTPATRFFVVGEYDDSAEGDSRLKVVVPGMPTYLSHTFGSNDAFPQEVTTGGYSPGTIATPEAVSGFAAPNQASVSFRADGTAIEMRLLLYLQLPHTNADYPYPRNTQQVRVVYRKANQLSFFDPAQPDTKLVFAPADITSFAVTALDTNLPTLTLSQSDVGSVTVGCMGAMDSMYGEFVVTATAQTPSYSFQDTTSYSPTTKTVTYSAAGFSGIPLQTDTNAALYASGPSPAETCTRWSAKLRWAFVSAEPTQYLLYIMFGGAADTWKTAYESGCLYSSTTFYAGVTMVAFALLRSGNTMTVTLPAPYWSGNGRTYWHGSPGFGLLGSVFRTEAQYERAMGPSATPYVPGLPFRHGTATLTVTRP